MGPCDLVLHSSIYSGLHILPYARKVCARKEKIASMRNMRSNGNKRRSGGFMKHDENTKPSTFHMVAKYIWLSTGSILEV